MKDTVKASLRLSAALAALSTLATLAACGRQPTTMAADLQRDLDQASTTSVELAPHARSTAVVSALELGQSAEPKVATPKTTPERHAPQRAKAPAVTHRAPTQQVAAANPTPEPQPVAQTPAPVEEAPAPAPVEVPAPTPSAPQPVLTTPIPSPSPSRAPSRMPSRGGRGGGWWSTGDVIRNAPFPINP